MGGGGVGGGITGVVGSPVEGAQSSARNHQRGKRLHNGGKGGRSDRRGADGKEVQGGRGKSERATLGSALRGMECRGMHKEPQCT